MSDRIRLLSDVVANQIAAGEVVNNPSSVVKEMMENAVDAGATAITVNFPDGGKELIQIVDDGCGMSPIDARMAFERHATSKIRQAEDIYAISTFGFRGEALASIGAVSEVEVRTRQRGDDFGTSVEVSGGSFRCQNAINCEEGTQFFVRNLFYNIPARRRFLDNSPREARSIKEEFRRVALCNPETAFTLFENDAPVYNLPPSNLRQRIINVIGKSIASNLLEVSAQTSVVTVEGFTGRPAASKQNNTEQYLFVNGRYFRSPYFQKAILQAYEKLIPANTKPSYFIHLKVDPQRIDVNVHPQKTEVKFEDGGALWQILNAAIRESLGKLGALPMMDFNMDTSVEIPVSTPGVVYRSPDIKPNPEFNPFNDVVRDVEAATRYGAPSREQYVDYISSMDEQDGAADESLIEFIEGEDALQGNLDFTTGEMQAEPLPIDERYCATVAGGQLVVVDMRRASEIVLFDRYISTTGNNVSLSQQLLFAEQVPLSMEECCLVRESCGELARLGLVVEIQDEHTVAVQAIPADMSGGNAGELLRQMLPTLGEHTSAAREERLRAMAATLARAGASAKKYTTRQAARELMEAFSATGRTFTPSGLPVAVRITNSEIKRRL